MLADYDNKQDPEGTRYFFKELGYKKEPEDEFIKDSDHNLDGSEKAQDINGRKQTVVDKVVDKIVETLPNTGEKQVAYITALGIVLVCLAVVLKREQLVLSVRSIKRRLKK